MRVQPSKSRRLPLLSARLSALARRLAALAAVLVMAGSFVSSAAAGSAPTAAVTVTNFPLPAELGPPSDPILVDQWGLPANGASNARSVRPRDRSILVARVGTVGSW